MSSAHKKVIVRRFTGETLPGYLPLSAFVRNRGIDLLDLTGRVIPLLLNDIKHVCYVRDFNLHDTVNPERLTRRTFLARPRTEGLWLRMTFRGGDVLEGLASTDIALLDDLLNDTRNLVPEDVVEVMVGEAFSRLDTFAQMAMQAIAINFRFMSRLL